MLEKSRILVADDDGIAAAVAELRVSGIVAVPTETVYGLAARASDAVAVARIYAAKGRPGFNPLIVHVAGVAEAETLVEVDAVARAFMAAFWPGALTLVLPLKAGAAVAGLVTAGLSTLAVRCPAHPVMQALIAQCGPLAAPSANASGRISSTTAAHAAGSLDGRVGLILDAGPCEAGVESTIIEVVTGGWRLLRPGAVPVEALRTCPGIAPGVREIGGKTVVAPGSVVANDPSHGGLGAVDRGSSAGEIVAPGMMESHYAPRQPVRLGAETALAGEFHIGFGAIAGDLNLSLGCDVVEAAARLFDVLHVAEASGCAAIAVAPIPETGLGAAINDRLRRAAAPR